MSSATAYALLDGVFQAGLRHSLPVRNEEFAQLETEIPRVLTLMLGKT